MLVKSSRSHSHNDWGGGTPRPPLRLQTIIGERTNVGYGLLWVRKQPSIQPTEVSNHPIIMVGEHFNVHRGSTLLRININCGQMELYVPNVQVLDCSVIMDKATGQSRGFAFVQVGSADQAQIAIQVRATTGAGPKV